jgi:NAD(P)-dependent dehydrogenase (short-subunit alcohol dehydrogenase family)
MSFSSGGGFDGVRASAGDRIVVRHGTYTESVTVTKTLHLVGRDRPTIDATGQQNGVVLSGAGSAGSTMRGFAVMLDGPLWLARAAGLSMVRSGGGRIVIVTSIHATNSERTSISYDAAKGGLDAATRTLALELGDHGVLVNSIAPGFVNTRMSVVDGRNELESDWFRDTYVNSGRIPLRRAAEPSEMAAAISHLVSTDNTYINGARIHVDGGLLSGF